MWAVYFFCGAGGMTEGLRQAGLHVVAGLDVDASVEATYTANHSAASRFERRDVRECSAALVSSWLPAEADSDGLVLVGCSPCQYWSRVPTRKERARAASTLLLEFARIIADCRPGYVVVENVPGLVTVGSDEVLQPFLDVLRLTTGGTVRRSCPPKTSDASDSPPRWR